MKAAYVFLPLLVGCTETVESTDVRTSGIYPEITVTATGNGNSTVTVRLKVGGNDSNTFLDLQAPDKLEVSVGDDTRGTEKSGNTYSVTFPEDAPGTEFTVAFDRNGDGDAPDSTVTLPEGFDLTVEDEEAVRPDGVVAYSWTPSGDGDMNWGVEGECIFDATGTTPDDGAATVEAEDIDATSSAEEEECTVRLELQRIAGGDLDPAFTEGGEIRAIQLRRGTFISRPAP